MKLILAKDAFHASAMAAHVIEGQLKQKPASWIGLSYSPTFNKLLEQLRDAHAANEAPFESAHWMGLYEYFDVLPTHTLKANLAVKLLDPIGVDAQHRHFFDPGELIKEASVFNQFLDLIEPLDLGITTIGADGHLAYNQAGTVLSPRIHIDRLTDSTRMNLAVDYDDLTEVPNRVLTFGVADLLRVRKLVVFCVGKTKSAIVKTVLESKTVSTLVPATMLLLHPNCILIADAEAASLLTIDKPDFQ
jgi:glucosamine-6-phosphate deaminase